MAGDVINLRMVRKRKARDGRAAQAAQNRIIHGESKAEKQARKAKSERDARLLDQARLDGRDDDERG